MIITTTEPTYTHRSRMTFSGLRSQLKDVPSRPLVVAVDGRSAGGKSTFARHLAGDQQSWIDIHTDDVAWWHSYFDWTELMADNILRPVRSGREVAYVPDAWRERGRSGAIRVPSGVEVLLVEGVGASRRELSTLIDIAIWVHTPWSEIERRERARLDSGEVDAPLQQDWMSAELAFLEDQQPWVRADVVVDGTRTTADELTIFGAQLRG